jgi:pimeloyl-ACP methyl ester carboxylesterase
MNSQPTANAPPVRHPGLQRPKLKLITAPVLLLQGRQELAGEANIYEAHLLIRNSTLKFINKCGHMPWLEQPAQTWKIVNEFLHSVP